MALTEEGPFCITTPATSARATVTPAKAGVSLSAQRHDRRCSANSCDVRDCRRLCLRRQGRSVVMGVPCHSIPSFQFDHPLERIRSTYCVESRSMHGTERPLRRRAVLLSVLPVVEPTIKEGAGKRTCVSLAWQRIGTHLERCRVSCGRPCTGLNFGRKQKPVTLFQDGSQSSPLTTPPPPPPRELRMSDSNRSVMRARRSTALERKPTS